MQIYLLYGDNNMLSIKLNGPIVFTNCYKVTQMKIVQDFDKKNAYMEIENYHTKLPMSMYTNQGIRLNRKLTEEMATANFLH